jgi:hypothetical protein
VRRSPPRHGRRVGEHTAREEQGVSLVTLFAPAKKVTRSKQASESSVVKPKINSKELDSGVRRNDEPFDLRKS